MAARSAALGVGGAEELALEDLGGQRRAVEGERTAGGGCGPCWWIVRATSRLPVPGSPTISTGTRRAGGRRTWSSSRRWAGPRPIRASRPCGPAAGRRTSSSSARSRLRLGVGDARRRRRRPDHAEQAEQPAGARRRTARTRRRRQCRSPPAWMISVGPPAGRPARASAADRSSPPGRRGRRRGSAPWAWQTSPTTDAAGWPVSSSQARFTQASLSAGSSQKTGSRACCQSGFGSNDGDAGRRHGDVI